ncbi:hypothetical protein T11_7214, partial [Trichinella zimbabwensis]
MQFEQNPEMEKLHSCLCEKQPVSDETLASSERENTNISNVALETDDSVSQYEREISCASPTGQFDPEDNKRKVNLRITGGLIIVIRDG